MTWWVRFPHPNSCIISCWGNLALFQYANFLPNISTTIICNTPSMFVSPKNEFKFNHFFNNFTPCHSLFFRCEAIFRYFCHRQPYSSVQSYINAVFPTCLPWTTSSRTNRLSIEINTWLLKLVQFKRMFKLAEKIPVWQTYIDPVRIVCIG